MFVMPTLAELKHRVDAAIAATKRAVAQSRQIASDAQSMQAEVQLARAQYEEMVQQGGRRCSALYLPQVRQWRKSKHARGTAYLLTLGELRK